MTLTDPNNAMNILRVKVVLRGYANQIKRIPYSSMKIGFRISYGSWPKEVFGCQMKSTAIAMLGCL